MPRFALFSDLHMEGAAYHFRNDAIVDSGCAAVLLAGDISSGADLVNVMAGVAAGTSLPVIAVLGNHEYYRNDFGTLEDQIVSRMAERNDVDIRLLTSSNPTVEVGGVRIVGSTLWTDYKFRESIGHTQQSVMLAASHVMNDFNMIKNMGHRLTPAHVLERHMTEKQAIIKALQKPFDGPTIVMTHHVPFAEGHNEKAYGIGLVDAMFISDLGDELGDLSFDYWIAGHTHAPVNHVWVDSTGRRKHLVSNIRGYRREWGTTGFHDLKIIDTDTREVSAPFI